MRQYGREDVEFSEWYSKWSKDLAARHTRDDLEMMAGLSAHDARKASGAHLRAIDATGSMVGCSQRRAQTGNVARANGALGVAINGALEIHDLFPEHAKATSET